jgi:excisionase family DNA binding protein
VNRKQESAQAPKFYDVQEVADMLKMSRMTVYRAIGTGELHAVRIRGRWLVPARVIDRLAGSGDEVAVSTTEMAFADKTGGR